MNVWTVVGAVWLGTKVTEAEERAEESLRLQRQALERAPAIPAVDELGQMAADSRARMDLDLRMRAEEAQREKNAYDEALRRAKAAMVRPHAFFLLPPDKNCDERWVQFRDLQLLSRYQDPIRALLPRDARGNCVAFCGVGQTPVPFRENEFWAVFEEANLLSATAVAAVDAHPRLKKLLAHATDSPVRVHPNVGAPTAPPPNSKGPFVATRVSQAKVVSYVIQDGSTGDYAVVSPSDYMQDWMEHGSASLPIALTAFRPITSSRWARAAGGPPTSQPQAPPVQPETKGSGAVVPPPIQAAAWHASHSVPPPVMKQGKAHISIAVWASVVVFGAGILFLSAFLISTAGRPASKISIPKSSSSQRDAEFFKSDPNRIEEMKRSEKPWVGKGLDPNFPLLSQHPFRLGD